MKHNAIYRKKRFTTKEIVFCGLFAALVAVGAFLKIPFPLVPLTLQPLFAMLAGLLLGPELGALSITVYILTGLAGVPVFTGGGGPGYIFNTTFGYLIGFVAGAWCAGKIAETGGSEPSYKRLLCACVAFMAVTYSIGMVYLWGITNLYLKNDFGLKSVLIYGFCMTAPSDVVKVFIAAALAQRIKKTRA